MHTVDSLDFFVGTAINEAPASPCRSLVPGRNFYRGRFQDDHTMGRTKRLYGYAVELRLVGVSVMVT